LNGEAGKTAALAVASVGIYDVPSTSPLEDTSGNLIGSVKRSIRYHFKKIPASGESEEGKQTACRQSNPLRGYYSLKKLRRPRQVAV
jgi:hypothetical protein